MSPVSRRRFVRGAGAAGWRSGGLRAAALASDGVGRPSRGARGSATGSGSKRLVGPRLILARAARGSQAM